MARRGRPLAVEWAAGDDAASLYARYRRERRADVRPRLHGLWLVRAGRSAREAAAVLGVHERSVQQGVAWYRAGGREEVAAHRKAGKGTGARATAEPQAAVVAEAAGRVRTAAEAVAWVKEAFGAASTVSGMPRLLRRRRCRPTVPRPPAEKADPAAQEAWRGRAARRRSPRPA